MIIASVCPYSQAVVICGVNCVFLKYFSFFIHCPTNQKIKNTAPLSFEVNFKTRKCIPYKNQSGSKCRNYNPQREEDLVDSKKETTMDVIIQLQNQFVAFMNFLYSKGFLDDQFLQLQKLQDETNPDFVVEVVSLFFKDSEILLQKMANCFQHQFVDFEQVDAHVHQLKGSSSSIGAQRVKNACISFEKQCEKSHDRYMRCLYELNQEYFDVRNKLQTLINLERQILAAGGTVPVLSCTR